jgi:hypothetical protein
VVTTVKPGEELPLGERMFAPIGDSHHGALVSGDVGIGLMLVAAVQAAVAFSSGHWALVDALLYAVLGALIWLTRSRVAAVLCFLAAGAAVILTLLGHIEGGPPSPGRFILLSATALALAGRALQSTFDYHRFAKAAKPDPQADPEAGQARS